MSACRNIQGIIEVYFHFLCFTDIEKVRIVSWNKGFNLFCVYNKMVTRGLATQGVRPSAGVILTFFSPPEHTWTFHTLVYSAVIVFHEFRLLIFLLITHMKPLITSDINEIRHLNWRIFDGTYCTVIYETIRDIFYVLYMKLTAKLTHWGRDKMAAIFQTTFSNAFSWVKMYEFRLRFHWSLFPRVQLTICQHWFR